MTMKTIALITDLAQPDLSQSDRLLIAPLQALGITATPVPWDGPKVDWRGYDALILRSCWEYHHQPARFRTWLTGLGDQRLPLWNPVPMVLWNMDKRYLGDLAERDVPIVPTVWLAQGDTPKLTAVLAQQGWPQAVIKPRISASAHDTWATSQPVAAADQARLAAMLSKQDLMVQPQLPEIAQGEWSLIFLAGSYSHAVLKRPAVGNIFVQEHLGGSAVSAAPDAAMIEQAGVILQQAIALTGCPALYARVDGVLLNGRFTLMELELIEPDLFLGSDDGAAARFARALAATMLSDSERPDAARDLTL